ncbi:MAG: hypothetical protein K0R00_1379 [Herbinix sp.]|jgi:cytidylate kinase|nr:hypothetical protein [Herbinix sp.]
MENYAITISRQFASLGRTIAKKMSEELKIEYYDRDIVEETSKRMGQPIPLISNEEESASSSFFQRKYPLGIGITNFQDEIFEVQTNIIRDLTKKESCIIVGRCASSILKDHPRCLNIYVYAPYEWRLHNCIETLKMDPKTAKKMIKEVDMAREKYRLRYGKGIENAYSGYNVMIDSSRFGVDKTASILTQIVKDTLL